MLSIRLIAAVIAATVLLAGCAGSVAPPVAIRALAPEQISTVKVTDVSAEANPGVIMTPMDLERIAQLTKANILAVVGTHPGGADVNVKLVFTEYDKGNAFARFMLAGLGQIRISADVSVVDSATGRLLGQYQVSKDFAFGGVYGGSTKIEDVEEGFVKSVAEIFHAKA
jgi:Domain of unknown function (DUF4410)